MRMRQFNSACKKRMKKVKIGEVEFESMAHASRKFGKNSGYIQKRYREHDKKMPDGTKIELIK